MANWARRMHRRAATIGNVVTSCGHPAAHPYPRRLEKVKFGVPLDAVCKNDIPGPLLVLILKLNKEAPLKKDIFRAPGHQGNMKKLVHFLQNGRLVNIDNFSVYTIASVLKKFLRKLPGGIFGPIREERLFEVIDFDNEQEKWNEISNLITTMPVFAQHLLVLLFGTFRVIATTADRAQTGMTSEALGVSVAPSFFHSCVSSGKHAKMEDVMRFKTATRIMKYLIDNFAVTNLYGRENYEYYSRITGRIFKVEEEWIYAFRYPPETTASREDVLEAQERLLQREADIWGLSYGLRAISTQEESYSTPALIHIPELGEPSTSGIGRKMGVPESTLRESHTRLSVSLEEGELFKGTSSSSSSSSSAASSSASSSASRHRITLEELKAINRYAESTKSLSYLPQVHERQTARMRTRSEWFLSSPTPSRVYVVPIEFEDGGRSSSSVQKGESSANGNGHRCPNGRSGHCNGSGGDHGKQPVRRTSSKEKKLLRRGSSKSKKDKENGNKSVSVEALHGLEKSGSPRRGSVPSSMLVAQALSSPSRTQSTRSVPELDCPESELQQAIPVTLAYKPRI